MFRGPLKDRSYILKIYASTKIRAHKNIKHFQICKGKQVLCRNCVIMFQLPSHVTINKLVA